MSRRRRHRLSRTSARNSIFDMLRRAVFITLISMALAGVGRAAETAILKGNHPPGADTTPSIGDADPTMPLAMEIHFAPRNAAELNQLLADQQNPASPNYHHWLKPGEFDQRFGASPADLDAVAQWLVGQGFAVQSTHGGSIRFSGTVGQAERAFATRIERFSDGNTYANVTDPSIPTRFAGVIANISGLDNMMHAMPVGPARRMPVNP
jgi:pseudomonalisin